MAAQSHGSESERSPVCALIVTYNRITQLRHSLSCALAQPFDAVFVVNNASTDGTTAFLEELAQHQRRLHLVNLVINGGGALGFEQGLRAVDGFCAGKGWVVLFDDDAWPVSSCLATFAAKRGFYEQQNLCGVAALVLSPDDHPVEINRPVLNLFRAPWRVLSQTLPSARSIRDLYHVPSSWLVPDQQSLFQIDAASFVGLFLNLDLLPSPPQRRYPRPDLFVYSDDTSYTLDLTRHRCRLALDPSLIFVHNSQSSSMDQKWKTPIWKNYYVVRNSFVLNRSLSLAWMPLLSLLTLLLYLSAAVRYLWCNRSAALLLLVLVAYWDGLRGYYRRSHRYVCELST